MANDLVTSLAFAMIKAVDAFHEKTTRPNRFWQTGVTYLKGTFEGAIGSSPVGNGSSYISDDLAAWLEQQGVDHLRGAATHRISWAA